MEMEANPTAGRQLMADPLAKDRASILSLGSPGISRNTEACEEWTAGPSGVA